MPQSRSTHPFTDRVDLYLPWPDLRLSSWARRHIRKATELKDSTVLTQTLPFSPNKEWKMRPSRKGMQGKAMGGGRRNCPCGTEAREGTTWG